MAPLYPTRKYAILSNITSTLFIQVLIMSNTVNSIIYYPIFGCLTTLFLSLIFVRNRHSICKCCRSKEERDRIDELTLTERDRSHADDEHNTTKSSLCCQCLKHRRRETNDRVYARSGNPDKLERNTSKNTEKNMADYHDGNRNTNNLKVNTNIQIEMTPQLSMPQSSEEPDTNEINEIGVPLGSDNEKGINDQIDIQDSDEEILEDGKITGMHYEPLKTISPGDEVIVILPDAYAMANDGTLSKQTSHDKNEQDRFLDTVPSPKPKHSERELPDGFKFVDEKGLNNPGGVQNEIMMETEKQQHSRKGSKHHMDPTNNQSIDPTELYASLFPSWTDYNSNTMKIYQREMTMTHGSPRNQSTVENTVIIRSNAGSPLPRSRAQTLSNDGNIDGGNQINGNVDLYGTEDIGPLNYNDGQVSAIQPSSPKNTPTLHHNMLLPGNTGMNGLVLLPTNSVNNGNTGSFDDQKMSQVIAKLNRVASPSAKNNNTPWGNTNVIRPKGPGPNIFTPVTSVTSAKSHPDDEDQEPIPNINMPTNISISPTPNTNMPPRNTILGTIRTMSVETPTIDGNQSKSGLSQQPSPIPVINEESVMDWNNMNMNFSQNMDALVIEDDGDVFDYSNAKSPQQLMSRYWSSSADTMKEQKSKSKSSNKKYQHHHAQGMSSNMMSMTIDPGHGHENTLSIFSMSNMSQGSHSRVPSQRPATATANQIHKFWANGKRESQHIKKGTLANVEEAGELRAQTSVASHLDFSDLEQHLKLLNILKSQGLMKNPIELLHSHQKLRKRRSHLINTNTAMTKQRSVSKREKFKKYRDKKRNYNNNNHGPQKSASYKE